MLGRVELDRDREKYTNRVRYSWYLPAISQHLLFRFLFRFGFVESDSRSDEGAQGRLVEFLAFREIDSTTGAAFETGVEQLGRVRKRSTFGEGHLDHRFVGFAGADHAFAFPDRNSAPLPFLNDGGLGCEHYQSELAENVASPIAEIADSLVDQGGRGFGFGWFARWHVRNVNPSAAVRLGVGSSSELRWCRIA